MTKLSFGSEIILTQLIYFGHNDETFLWSNKKE